jgi:alkylation response protein AidB-like acyl-CoA dehydrogenase
MSTLPTIDEFVAEVDSHLSARYPKAKQEKNRNAFVWGEGSDEVHIFREPDPDDDGGALAAIRSWRAGLWEAGLGWISGPTEHGGRGLPGRYQRAFEEVVRRYQVPGESVLTIGLGMIAPTILRHGTPEQVQRYMKPLYSAELIACQLFSEPGAGSDLASLSTRAVRDEDGTWRITGQKVWTSGAHLSDIGEIICKTSDTPKHGNLTAFIVDMRAPGVTVRPLRQMTGGAAFNEVFFDDVVVSDSDRLGEVGQGWQVAITTLANERGAIGGSAFGGGGLLSTERIAELVRRAGRANDPVARCQFGELMVALRVVRYHQQVTAARAKAGVAPGPEAGLGKIALSHNMAHLGRFTADMFGTKAVVDTGEWGTYAWTELLLGAPAYRIAGGTDEVLKNSIAHRVLGLPRNY